MAHYSGNSISFFLYYPQVAMVRLVRTVRSCVRGSRDFMYLMASLAVNIYSKCLNLGVPDEEKREIL